MHVGGGALRLGERALQHRRIGQARIQYRECLVVPQRSPAQIDQPERHADCHDNDQRRYRNHQMPACLQEIEHAPLSAASINDLRHATSANASPSGSGRYISGCSCLPTTVTTNKVHKPTSSTSMPAATIHLPPRGDRSITDFATSQSTGYRIT